MSEAAKLDTRVVALLDARLSNARLVEETVKSLMPGLNADPKPVQVRTETGTKFTIGLDDMAKPKNMTIEIAYTVVHSLNESNKRIVEYESKHLVLFAIERSIGIDSWLKTPTVAIAPYFAMVHGLAMRRAEHTFLDMGLRGVALPRIADYAVPALETAVLGGDTAEKA